MQAVNYEPAETVELTPQQLADLLGVTTHQLGNWARPRILANATGNPRYLPRPYTLNAVTAWLARPANAHYREVVLAALVPDAIRNEFEHLLQQRSNAPAPDNIHNTQSGDTPQ